MRNQSYGLPSDIESSQLENQSGSPFGKGAPLLAILGGVLGGMAASRLLPPILAGVNGAVRGRVGKDPFDLLIEQHKDILTYCNRMLDQNQSESRMKRMGNFLMLKRTLTKHAIAEEDVVYPRLYEQDGDDTFNELTNADRAKHLYAEHADMKILLFDIEQCLMENRDWNEDVRNLRDLVQQHANEEEQIVFPKLREQYREEMGTFSGQIRREEAMVL